MGTFSTLKKLSSAFSGDKNLLDSKTVYNLFPNGLPLENEKNIDKKDFAKRIVTMLNDCNILLALGSITSETKRKVLSSYNKFKKNFKTKSRPLVDAWNKAVDLRPSAEDGSLDELRKSYEAAREKASELYSDAQKAKKSLADYAKEAESKKLSPEEMEEISKKIKENTDKIEEIKKEWIDCLKRAKEDISKVYKAKYEGSIKSAESVFREYSISKEGNKGKETEKSKKIYEALVNKTYKWRKIFHREKTKRVIEVYEAFCKSDNFDEWFKSTFKEYYDFCKSVDSFDVKISKQVREKYSSLENDRKEALVEISALEREIIELEKLRKNHPFKTFKDTPKSKKDALKDMKGDSKGGKYIPEVREYTPEAKKLFEPIEEWMKKYNEFEVLYRKYLELSYKYEKYFESAEKAKEQFQSVVDDFQLLKGAKLIDDYNESKYSEEFNKTNKKQEITLLQVVMRMMYYFQQYLKFYDSECKKYKNISSDISNLNADYKKTVENMGVKFFKVPHVS